MHDSPAHSMYYLAVLCPPEMDEKVLQFKYWMRDRFGSTVALKSPAHITLIPPFWLNETRETMLFQTLLSFSSDLDELVIQLKGFSHFGKKVLFVQVKEDPAIEQLKNQVESHFIRSFGDVVKNDDRPFHPHITIATRDIKPSDFEKAWEYFSGKEFNALFRIKTISLLKLGPGKWNVAKQNAW